MSVSSSRIALLASVAAVCASLGCVSVAGAAVTIDIASPAGWTSDTTPIVSYTVSGATDGVTSCGVDSTPLGENGAFVPCQLSPFLMPVLEDGQHTLWINHAPAGGGLIESVRTFGVDTTPPMINVAGVSDDQVFTQPHVSVQVAAQDLGSGMAIMRCSWDGAVPKNCSDPDFTSAVLDEGLSTLLVIASDRVGNIATRSVEVTLETDPVTLLLDAPTVVAFKLKRGKLKKKRYPATVTATFAIPVASGEEAPDPESCDGDATIQIQYRSRQLTRVRATLAASGTSCVARVSARLLKKYRKKRLTMTLDYTNGPFTPFSVTSRSLRF
jgi:hypothetical protein